MTKPLFVASSTTLQTPAEVGMSVLQRATAADTRLTAAERGLLSVLTLMQFGVTTDLIIIALLGPQLKRVFGINTEQFSYTVAAYAFGAGLASFSAAFFLDRFDRKRALLVLFTGFTAGTFRWALAPGYHAMLAACFVTGVCGGVVLAIVGDAIPEVRRVTVMGAVMRAFPGVRPWRACRSVDGRARLALALPDPGHPLRGSFLLPSGCCPAPIVIW